MKTVLQCLMPKWSLDGIKRIAKSHDLSVSDFNRLAVHYFILNYKGPYDHDTLDRLEFEVRKKIESLK